MVGCLSLTLVCDHMLLRRKSLDIFLKILLLRSGICLCGVEPTITKQVSLPPLCILTTSITYATRVGLDRHWCQKKLMQMTVLQPAILSLTQEVRLVSILT